MKQLALPLRLLDEATFANFYHGNNAELIYFLQKAVELPDDKTGLLYLWGEPRCGRSHLLQACCHFAEQQQRSVIYFSLKDQQQLTPAVLENMENFSLLAIDDIDAIANKNAWEEALFHLYNRVQTSQSQLIVSATTSPLNLNFHLKDLQSRLAAGLTFQMIPLNDEQKIAALRLRAQARGLNVSPQIAKFLLNHYQRDMEALFQMLEKLDQISLVEKRKLTVPLIKQII